MKTVIFEVRSPESAMDRAMGELQRGQRAQNARITFRSPASMSRVLTPTRWDIIETLTGSGPLGVREVGRRLERDVKGVHTDLNALVTAGVIDKTESGKYLFPFDVVRVSFAIHHAA